MTNTTGGTLSKATALPTVKRVLRQHVGGEWRSLAAVCDLGGRTVLIPADVPCGECGACRRAFVSACVAPTSWLASDLAPTQEIGGRFAYDFDTAAVAESQAPWAALLLPWLEAMGRTGLGAGDLSFWLGESPVVLLGAFLANARGSRVIVSGPADLGRAFALLTSQSGDHHPTFAPLDALDDQSLQAYGQSPGGFAERFIFTHGDDSMSWSAAGTLLAPGATLVVFGELPALAGLPADARIFTLGTSANPDFLPEALAAIARDPSLLDVCRLLAAGGGFEVVEA